MLRGKFSVIWKGQVFLNETISVTDGTVLNVTNGDANSSIIGDGNTRLFTVVNASLYLSNVVVSNGNGIYGGAVAAFRSTLTFESVIFDGNKAIQGGGALSLSDGTIVSLDKEVIFVNNTAYGGGAMYVTNGSNVLCTGNTTFSENVATSGDGGAIYATDGSNLVWTAASQFLDNNAEANGGALYLSYASSATFNKKSLFFNNIAEFYGGALHITDGSSATWNATSRFSWNRAYRGGGALYVSDGSSARWNAESYFSNNRGEDGGALYLDANSSATWNEESSISNNRAGYGGALYLSYSSSATWNAESFFFTNRAGYFGGVLYMDGSSATWNAESLFSTNGAKFHGGVLYMSSGSSVAWNAESIFSTNRAGDDGGVLHMSDSCSATWNAESLFSPNNTAIGIGGALYLIRSSATWNAKTIFSSNKAGYGGGALYLSGSSATWNAESSFSTNVGYNRGIAGDDGGGALYLSGSSATWSTEESGFTSYGGNGGIEYDGIDGGGALYLYLSNATWNAESFFSNNRAEHDGGALYLSASSATWNAESFFSNNMAGYDGGAICSSMSSATWIAKSTFSNNSAFFSGGALSLLSNFLDKIDGATWNAESCFYTNTAGHGGGALYLSNSGHATWNAESFFSANMAGDGGGALSLSEGGNATWNAETYFYVNIAGDRGGALDLYRSSVTWNVESFFSTNRAEDNGGSLYLSEDSSATWNAKSFFSTNRAEYDGGALYLSIDSNATWNAESYFSANRAQSDGGAVYASEAEVSWNGPALLINNTARNGGAIFVRHGATVKWTGQTEIISNIANVNGGAVGSRASSKSEKQSVITIKGATIFSNNTCGGNGGGMALVQSIAVLFESNKATFSYNSAGASGGAVFIAGTPFGPVFMNVVFLSNHAQTGGGVRETESGTAVTIDGQNRRVVNPTTFVGCKFIDNFASGIGGAVDSASGQDIFDGTLFEGNQARLGGALRLAGTASVVNCSFIDNASNFGGGPAISNIGSISTFTNVSFRGNVFHCENQTFLEFKVEDPMTVLCDGCPDICVGCSFGEKQMRPTCTSLSEAGIEHASSEGGITTIEGLYIHRGYWRATNISQNVNKCFNTKACSGGMTDALDFCLSGYEGPYCSVCSKNYVSSLNFKCRRCSPSAVGFAVAAVVTVLIAAVGLATVSYLLSTEGSDAGPGIMARVTQRLPIQSVKIITVVWQILTQFASMSSVTFPAVYQKLLNGVNVLNFDLTWAFSAGCFLEIDFHDWLLWTTIPPVMIMALLGGTYTVAVHRIRERPNTDLSNVRQKHVSVALMLTFLVYSNVSSVLFQMFACEDLDDGKRYLRADYTIECDSPKHRSFQFYASLMMLVYPIGIPATYAALLLINRPVLRHENGGDESVVARSMSSLWKPYKPKRYYYEVIECSRRILLAGVIVFIYPNSVSQIAVAVVIAVVFVFVSEALDPFHSPWDAWVSRLGHAIIFASMYSALLLKVDVSSENTYSQKAFEVVLVAANGGMVLLVVLEAVVIALLIRAGRHLENPRPRRLRL